MIRVTVELVSAISSDRSRVLGHMEICNDATGDLKTGNYTGTLHAEYTGLGGRKGEVKGFQRQKQSVFSLVGAFLKQWGHTKHVPAPQKTLSDLEGRLLVECAYWRARAAGVSLFASLPPIMHGVLQDAKVPGVSTDKEGLAIIEDLKLRMLFNTPAIPQDPLHGF